MQQASSPVLQQQLRLHPESLQTLHQPTDGTLYPHHHQGLPELQTLHTTDIVYQQPYALTGPPQPQPPSHALPVHFEQRGLPSSGPYPSFPAASYQQHVASPRFIDAPPPPLQEHAQQHYHIAAPETAPKPIQQLPFSPSVTTTLQTTHPLPQHVEQAPLQQQQQQQQQPPPPPQPQLQPQPQPQRQEGRDSDDAPFSSHGQFQGLKLIPNPPNLEEWRNKLFHVDDMITLTEEQFQTYFPHIDNIYSHRSTQKHKRRRFVSHYWDCRLKGRPPGTKKSTDPDKKKRKRVARERDLCDVKIKITEFFDRQEYEEQLGCRPPGTENDGPSSIPTQPPVNPSHVVDQNQNPNPQFFGQGPLLPQQPAGGWDMPPNMSGQPEVNLQQYMPPPSLPPQKFYTFQRVNGNGGNGKGDGVAGPHKHTLEESDRVKKNSVIRWQMKADKEDKKKSHGGDPSKKTYHKKATGNALTTVKNHSKEDDLKLYGSAFCPFVQRVWISLEHKQIPYQYIEVDPYKKPQSLLDVNPHGLVPALRHGPTWSTHESTVIMEYLEDLQKGPPLLPPDAQGRATSRLWSDHINRNIIPCFYKLLQAQDQSDQVSHATEFRNQIGKLVDAADPTGPFFLGPHISFVDVQIAPWIIRLRRVLGPYRGWPEAEAGSRWKQWVDAIEADKSVRMTTSTDELYLDSYERYAENRPGTSQLADAVNSGRGLP